MADDDVAKAADDEELLQDEKVVRQDDERQDETSPEIEAVARRLGWRPEDQFKGKGQWLPPGPYVEKVNTEIPVMRERLRYQDDQIAKRDREITNLTTTFTARFDEQSKVLGEVKTFYQSQAQQAYDRAARDIEAKKKAAVASADTAAYDDAEAERAALDRTKPVPVAAPVAAEADKPKPVEQPPPKVDPAAESWIKDNVSWYKPDLSDAVSGYAYARHAELLREKPELSLAANLAMVTEDVRATFPHKFENPKRTAAAAVAVPNGGGRPGKRGRTANDLPAEEKAMMDSFIKLIPGYTEAEFLKDYPWGSQ